MPPTQRTLVLSVMDGFFAISKLAADATIPEWAMRGSFSSVTRTADELSLVTFDEVGVLSALATPLTRIGIGIFLISTFDTDYLLVEQDEIPAAVEALEHAGHRILRLELLTS